MWVFQYLQISVILLSIRLETEHFIRKGKSVDQEGTIFCQLFQYGLATSSQKFIFTKRRTSLEYSEDRVTVKV